MVYYNFFIKFFRYASKPGENSCGASGILGISTPSGNSSITSRVPPSSNSESPLNILSNNASSPSVTITIIP